MSARKAASTKKAPRRKPAAKPVTGRPSKYRPEYAEQAAKLCRLYATDLDLAEFFGVAERTIAYWKLNYPAFGEALKRTKAEMDTAVEQSLARRALGYTHASEEVFQYQGAPVRVRTEKHYPPDVVACIFWLKNRQPDRWKDRPEGVDVPPEFTVKVRRV